MKRFVLCLALLGLALIAACGKKDARAPVALEGPPVVPVKAPSGPVSEGQVVFNKTCALCHGAGTGGAPRPGDKAAWAPRIAKGKEMLYRHALEGFAGTNGYMPPRGGYPNITDAQVRAGVDYMVEQSK